MIDKDFCSALLAENLNADVLLILTAVDRVKINYRTPDEKSLDSMTLSEVDRYVGEGQFSAGSMLPKVQAAARFVSGGKGRKAVIAALSDAGEAAKGNAGTVITA